MEDEDMPVDAAGNRADVIIDPTSIVSRINIGMLYEQYINGASRDVCKLIRETLGVSKGDCSINKLYGLSEAQINTAYGIMLQYFKITNVAQHDFYFNLGEEERLEVLMEIVNDDLYTYLPTDNQKSNKEIVKELEATFHPTYSKVTYRNDAGVVVETERNVRVAPIYYMYLDKIADEWSSVSSAKLQHFGVLTPTTKSERFTLPYKNSPVRFCGETEGRILAGYCGPEATAEIMDRSNNPQTTRNIVWKILNSDKPTELDTSVDRLHTPLGATKPLMLIKHVMACAGFKPLYEPDDRKR